MKLVQTLVVRDEADIVDDQIAYVRLLRHADRLSSRLAGLGRP